jgi:two-component system response regulator YesN
MEKAAGYLEDTTLSVKEICSAVGMKSTSYFSSLFRRVYGLSPKEYRYIYGGCPKRYRQIYG